MTAIELDSLEKRYGPVRALSEVTLDIDAGDVFALVGPNGSGKTTLLNVLLGLIRPTDGTATIFGDDTAENPRAARSHIGVVPEGYGVYERLTGRRHVEFAARSRGIEVDPTAILDRVGLAEVADRPAGAYSGGMAKRLVLSLALVGEPELLLLDEPFYGLDPVVSETLRSVIREERDRGTTVLFTTHLFREVRTLADRVAMLSDGVLVIDGTLDELVDGEPTVEALEGVFREAVGWGTAA